MRGRRKQKARRKRIFGVVTKGKALQQKPLRPQRKRRMVKRTGARQAGPEWLIGIGYVNRPDLLKRALNSISAFRHKTVVIDNSPDHNLQAHTLSVEVYTPDVPLTFSQTMNALYRLAAERGCKAAVILHNDAEPPPRTVRKFVRKVERLLRYGGRWGAVFTHYHTLAAFRLKAVRRTGEWDTFLPRYFADNDYYRRMRLAGYTIVETGLPVAHHLGGSATIKSDRELAFLNSVTFPLYEEYYKQKWGGIPGQETFLEAFNLRLNEKGAAE
ncbi:MAG TPA: glycosyltransferase family 2 protein [Bacilli bacterium]